MALATHPNLREADKCQQPGLTFFPLGLGLAPRPLSVPLNIYEPLEAWVVHVVLRDRVVDRARAEVEDCGVERGRGVGGGRQPADLTQVGATGSGEAYKCCGLLLWSVSMRGLSSGAGRTRGRAGGAKG